MRRPTGTGEPIPVASPGGEGRRVPRGVRLSVVEEGQIEATEAVGVDDRVDFGDLAAGDGEPDEGDRLPGGGYDHARGPVHQDRPLGLGGLGDREGSGGNGGRAV